MAQNTEGVCFYIVRILLLVSDRSQLRLLDENIKKLLHHITGSKVQMLQAWLEPRAQNVIRALSPWLSF